jgi:hypothetical protein
MHFHRYFGHGGGEQYIRSHRIRGLPTCAATLLWGCSSGALKDMGDFDRIGTPYNYMLGGWYVSFGLSTAVSDTILPALHSSPTSGTLPIGTSTSSLLPSSTRWV